MLRCSYCIFYRLSWISVSDVSIAVPKVVKSPLARYNFSRLRLSIIFALFACFLVIAIEFFYFYAALVSPFFPDRFVGLKS